MNSQFFKFLTDVFLYDFFCDPALISLRTSFKYDIIGLFEKSYF